jgi:hypothetical protein
MITATLTNQPHPAIKPGRDVLRRNILDRLDQLDDVELSVLHEALLRSIKQRLWEEISTEAGQDHQAGLMKDLPNLLREARHSLHASA